jgi:UDP-glucuronate decarboxylase
LACPASPIHYQRDPVQTTKTCVHGAINMLGLSKRLRAKILQASTSEIYGDPDSAHVPTPESYRGQVSCQGPRACYDESKRVGETLCYIFHEKHGVATTVIRPFNIFGPGMQETDYRVLPNFASRIKSGKPLSIYGKGSQTRTFCYVTPRDGQFMLVILKGFGRDNMAIPEISCHLAGRVESVIGRPIARNIIEYPDSYPADEPNRRCPDIRKARLQLGYAAQVKLDEGLRRFLGWSQQTYVGES